MDSTLSHPSIIPDSQCANEYTYALNFLLRKLRCPPCLGHYILVISWYASNDLIQITDKRVATEIGRSRNTVSRLRKKLREWMTAQKCQIIQVEENDFDPVARKIKPTAYQFLITDLLNQIVRLARNSARYEEGDWRGALRAAVKELQSEVQISPLWRHRPARRMRSIQSEADELRTRWENLSRRRLEFARKFFDEGAAGHRDDLKIRLDQLHEEMIFKECAPRE